MPDGQFKRNIAYKYRIGDLSMGQPSFEGERFTHLNLDNKRVVRVNIIGNVVERYDAEGEKKYCFITLDDASGQIKLKAFGDDTNKLSDCNQGETILVIGTLRNFNNETYISPEIVKEKDPKYLLLRKLEVEKNRSTTTSLPTTKEQISSSRESILDKIKSSESGIEIEELKIQLREISPEIIDSEIQKALEEGVIFEPRPGILRYLG